MHSTTVISHGFELLDHHANGWRHTDYRFQVISTMWTKSERNRGGKFFIVRNFHMLLVTFSL